jgi:hypothetical protein
MVSRFGHYAAACSETKYMYNFEVYVKALSVHTKVDLVEEGAHVATVNHDSGYGVVSKLTSGLEGRFHYIAMDNFFSSP